MADTNWPADLARREREQSGDPMEQIVGICRAGHERAMRQNGCPLAIRLWADQPASYSTWRELHEERWWSERSNQGRERC